MRKDKFKVSVIIPIMNEEECIPILVDRIIVALRDYFDYELLFIDDGSTDDSLNKIKEIRLSNPKVHFLSFSRNFGHQNALKAGYRYATGDCILSLDGDMQHPPELIPQFINKWLDGYDIVYSIRKDTGKTPFLKRLSSRFFYKLMNLVSDIKFDEGEADFRLIDKRAAAELNKLRENSIFYRGIIKWLGFNQISIVYTPVERKFGSTKYSRKKMVALALSGITSFSVKPLRISTFIGTTIAFLSIFYGFYALYVRLFTNNTIEGWTSVFFMVAFIGGIQLIMIGILGEYLGKLFIESKDRPNFIIKESSLIDAI
jgi:polyisoprenyl-phosphate glycosyltransferase